MTSNQPSSFFPSLSGYYRDPGNDIHNVLFPTVSNYQDGRLLVLILGLIFSFVIIFIYTIGYAPRWCQRFDSCTGTRRNTISTPGNHSSNVNNGTTTVTHNIPPTSKFGGIMTIAGIMVGLAVCMDVLIQYSSDWGIESTYTVPPISLQPERYAGTIIVNLVAYAPTSMIPCTVIDINNRGSIQSTWKLIQRESAVRTNTTFNASIASFNYATYSVCKFTLITNDYLLSIPYYYSSTLPSSLQHRLGETSTQFTLGYGLQIIEWDLTINDAKDQAYTRIVPYDTITSTYEKVTIPLHVGTTINTSLPICTVVPTNQRAHIIGLRMYTAKYTDRSFYDSVGETVQFGYRGTGTQYSIEDTTGTNGAVRVSIPTTQFRGDTFALMYSRTDLVISTVKIPRFSILSLLGIIFGLGIGTGVIFRILYLYCELGCSCSTYGNVAPKEEQKDNTLSSSLFIPIQRWFTTKGKKTKVNVFTSTVPSSETQSSSSYEDNSNNMSSSTNDTSSSGTNVSWDAVTAAAVQGALRAPRLTNPLPVTQIISGSTITNVPKKPVPPPPKLGKFREPSLRLVAYTPVQNVKNMLKRNFSIRSPPSSSILSSVPPSSSSSSGVPMDITAPRSGTNGPLSSYPPTSTVTVPESLLLSSSAPNVTNMDQDNYNNNELTLPNTTNPYFGRINTANNNGLTGKPRESG